MSTEDFCIIAAFGHNSSSSQSSLPKSASLTVKQCKVKHNADDVGKISRKRHHHGNDEIAYKMTVDGRKITYIGRPVANSNIDAAHLLDFPQTTSLGSEWMLAIRNKRTGETTFKPAIFVNFKPEIDMIEDKETVVMDKERAKELRNKLTMQFGSKKKQRALEVKLANTVNDKSLSEMIHSAVAQVKIDDESNDTANGSILNGDETSESPVTSRNPYSSVLPSFNANATNPAEIFDINDIVTPEECLLLDTDARTFSQMLPNQRKESNFNEYTCELALNLPHQAAPRQMRSVYLIYFDYLLKLCEVSSKHRTFELSIFEAEALNAELIRRLMIKYAEKQQFSKKKGTFYKILSSGKDKLLAHLIILNLNLHQFSFPLSKLSKLLTQVNESKLVQICNLLGCNVKQLRTTGERLVTLVKPPQGKIYSGGQRRRKF